MRAGILLALGVLLTWLPVQAAALPGGTGQVLRARLDNGLRVIIVRNPLAPVAAEVMNYGVGSNEAPAGFPGMAHAEEHMMFRGSPGLSADQLADITAAMGGMFDADTQQNVTQYFFTVPADDLDAALHIEAIRMRGILDTQALWAQERGAIEQEVAQDLSNPEYLFYTRLLEAMFRGTPYAHDALGTRPSFNQTTGAMLKQFHATWYAPNNATLVIVGNVDPAKTLDEVRKLFAGIPAKKLPARPSVHLQPVKTETLDLKTDLPYGLDVLSFRMPGWDSPDYAAVRVLSDVLSSQRGQLYSLVPEGKALYAGFELSGLPKAGLGYALVAYPRGADAAALLAKTREILAGEVRQGVPPDLVEAARRRAITSAEFEKNSVTGLAMAWSQAVAVEGRQSPEEIIDAIQRVTPADVNRVARKYLRFDQSVTAVLTPQSSGKPISTKSFGGKESFAPTQTKPVTLPAWAEQAVARVSVPASAVHPVVSVLPNGLKLIVQPESVSRTVMVMGHIKNDPDLETPPGQEGVGQVLDQLFSFGTTSLDRIAFQKALDEIGASAGAGPDFSLRALSSELDRGVQLLADNELHPALPEKAFPIVRQQVAGAVAGEIQSPSYLAHRALDAGLFPRNDPTLRQATPATVSALTLPEVKSYYQHVFRPDLTTIVVIGNVQPDAARSVIEKYFGGWKATGPKPATEPPPVPPNTSTATAVPDSSRVQDQVTLAETLGLTRSNPDYYALQLGDHVLGGAFYATRLYRDLRENAGLVYFVAPSLNVRKTRGLYSVVYGCDPQNVAKARAIIVRDLTEMQKAPAGPHELQQAKALLLREIPLSESSENSIAAGLIARSTEDLPLDEPTQAAQRYVKLTAGQVQAAFAKWLRPGGLVRVTLGPAPH